MRFFTRMFLVFTFLRASWSPGDAVSSPPADLGPCKNYPCGPPEGAVCIPVGKNYECQCRTGYRRTHFKTCVPEGPCGTYPCGPNSERCVWVGDQRYRCKCKQGFAEVSLVQPTCLKVEGECGNHPCGLGGLCRPTADGTHQCECLPGYEPAPSTKGITCRRVQKIGCESQPCGDETIARCVDTAHGYFCICREGSLPYFNDNGDPNCVPEQGYVPCYSGACGEKGTLCTFDGERRACTCEAGYEGKSVNLWEDQRCYSASKEEEGTQDNGTGGTSEDGKPGGTKPEKKISNTVLIAGGVLAAVLLLGAIAGGFVYQHRKRSNDQGPVDHQGSVDFEGRDGAGAHGAEGDILIKASNEDWAH